MDNRYGDVILYWDDFDPVLEEFARKVAAKRYDKMDYNMWRQMSKHRSNKDEVVISWDCEGIKIYFPKEDECHFFCWGNGFAEYLWKERIKYNWSDWSDVTIHDTFIKDTIASAPIDICAQSADTWVSTEIDTKVDKAEFDARIKELTDIVDKYINKKENENMNAFKFDFGPINGNTVRVSMYGMAVKNKAGTWVSYDAKAGEIMDVDVFNFDGANFIYKMPVAMKDIAVGDVVIHHGAPMFVVGKSTDGKGLVVIDVIAGERKEVMLAKSPFGFNFATKVVNFLGNAFNGSANADNPFGNMWMLMAMSGDNKDMSDMLPFMMMANGGNIDSNMLMFMAMSGKGGNDMLPMLMMMNAMNAPAPAHNCSCGCGEHHN